MENKPRSDRFSLDIELKDILNAVSQAGHNGPTEYRYSNEGEELRKAWFEHMLDSIEKLYLSIEDIRRRDLPTVREEFKDRLEKIEREVTTVKEDLKAYLDKLEVRLEKAECNEQECKQNVLAPMRESIATLKVKIAVWSAFWGFAGSTAVAFIFMLLKHYVFKQG